MKSWAPLGCGVQTGAGAVVNSLGAQPGTSIAVFGVGPVGLHKKGRFPFDRMITFYDFDQINSAVEDMEMGRVIKPVLKMGRQAGR